MTGRDLEVDVLAAPPDCSIALPGSKSLTNRVLLTAALAEGRSVIDHVLVAEDTLAMMDCMRAIGAEVSLDADACRVEVVGTGGHVDAGATPLWVRQSGTTARFLLPLAALSVSGAVVDGDDQIRNRPQSDLLDALRSMGARPTPLGSTGRLPVRFEPAPLRGGRVLVAGNVSSQFVSGLLLSAPVMDEELELELTGSIVSVPYLRMTVSVMRRFGAEVTVVDDRTYVVQPSGYQACDIEIEPDASTASYFFAAAALSGGAVTVERLGSGSAQGDLAFVDVLAAMGAQVDVGSDRTVVRGPEKLGGIDISMRDFSDTAPTLGAIAPLAAAAVTVRDIGFIRHKESDRIAAVVAELTRLGADAEELDDGFVVRPSAVHGGRVTTYDDHRIAMAFTVLGLVTPGIVIADPHCVAKTFPGFFDAVDELRSVGDRELAVLAIDGPAGSGKSTVARLAADRLGLEVLDTGAMYRSVALAAIGEGVDIADAEGVTSIARRVDIEVGADRVTIDGVDVTAEIRTEQVNAAVSIVAAHPGVRSALRRQQRTWARRRGGGVMEGRDIGSVVFPEARLKVYVTAAPEERARRRSAESGIPPEEILAAIVERDALDSARRDSPLVEASGSLVVDTTGLTIDEVVDRVVEAFG